jgi:hypothetical protein
MFKKGNIIQFKEDHNLWGIVTSLSDDETCVYYKPRGIGLFYLCALVDKMELVSNKN